MTTLRRLGVAFGAALFVVGVLPSCTATANVSDVWLSLDEDGARHRSVFYTDTKAIYCIAEVVAGRDNATLEMQLRRTQAWDFAKNAFVDVNIVSSYMEQKAAVSKAPAPVVLKVPRTSVDARGVVTEDDNAAFLPGLVQCEVRLDGELKDAAAFTIEFAPCPTEQIHAGATCFGFYPRDRACPASGASGNPTPTCTCTDKGWQC